MSRVSTLIVFYTTLVFVNYLIFFLNEYVFVVVLRRLYTSQMTFSSSSKTYKFIQLVT